MCQFPCVCTGNTQYNIINDLKLFCFFIECPKKTKYIFSSIPHHRGCHAWLKALTILESTSKNVESKNIASKKWRGTSRSPSPLLSLCLSLSLILSPTGSVWWWCQCLDSAAAYLHQSSQLDREEKDFPAQPCQWVSEICPHKNLAGLKPDVRKTWIHLIGSTLGSLLWAMQIICTCKATSQKSVAYNNDAHKACE